jgi:hypothetical protein
LLQKKKVCKYRLLTVFSNINDKVEEIRVVVKDATFLLPDSFLGQVTFSLHSLMDGVPHDEWYSLESRAGKKDKVL